jgi:hypothetical protein
LAPIAVGFLALGAMTAAIHVILSMEITLGEEMQLLSTSTPSDWLTSLPEPGWLSRGCDLLTSSIFHALGCGLAVARFFQLALVLAGVLLFRAWGARIDGGRALAGRAAALVGINLFAVMIGALAFVQIGVAQLCFHAVMLWLVGRERKVPGWPIWLLAPLALSLVDGGMAVAGWERLLFGTTEGGLNEWFGLGCSPLTGWLAEAPGRMAQGAAFVGLALGQPVQLVAGLLGTGSSWYNPVAAAWGGFLLLHAPVVWLAAALRRRDPAAVSFQRQVALALLAALAWLSTQAGSDSTAAVAFLLFGPLTLSGLMTLAALWPRPAAEGLVGPHRWVGWLVAVLLASGASDIGAGACVAGAGSSTGAAQSSE